MKNKALYAFESVSLGKGLKAAQEVLEKFGLELHGAHPISGGRFLFIAFEGAAKPTAQEFQALLHGEVSLCLETPNPGLVHGLLHLQPDPQPEATGVVVLEADSPVDLLSCLNDHLKLPELQLYQMNLGVKNKPYALLASQSSAVLDNVVCLPSVTRTHLEKISPQWRQLYFV